MKNLLTGAGAARSLPCMKTKTEKSEEPASPAPTRVIDVSKLTSEEMCALNLSYYTLCKWADATHFVDPRLGVPSAIARGEYKGVLTLDSLGNFLSFE